MIRLIDLLPTCLLTLAIFDVFSQIQYNGGMPRQVQACLKLNRRTGLIPVVQACLKLNRRTGLIPVIFLRF